jgi:hypothetical protein
MKKGVEIVPEENYRLRNEDLFASDPIKFGSKAASKNGSVASDASLETAQSYQKEFPDGYSE